MANTKYLGVLAFETRYARFKLTLSRIEGPNNAWPL